MRALQRLAGGSVLLICATLYAQPLRDLAAERGIHISAAVDPSRLSESAYATTLGREFNQLEPENATKFGPIHPTRTGYNFGPPDTLVGFARDHGMAVRGHVFVWHSQNPAWLTNGNFTPAELAGILQDHITTVARHFAGQIYAWDVVNEAFNDNGTLRSTIWYDSPGIGADGTGYIEQAFQWARAADPQALLFYNDYSAETVNAKSDAIYRMAQDFKARGVPIDGIGLQAHFTSSPVNAASLEANIRRLTDLGLQVQLTEFDVRLRVDGSGNATPGDLATQAQIYQDVTAACLKFPLCTAIQTWGFTDRYSWVPGTFTGFGAALPLDSNYQVKPAYTAMQNALLTAPPVIGAAGIGNAASYAGGSVAPGEIVVLFGPTYGPAALATATADSGALPKQVSDARLWFDGEAAPLLYAKTGQMGAIVPFAVAGKTTTQMQYEYRGIRSNTVTIPVTPTLPGLFTMDGSGSGAGAILDTDYRLIAQDHPARKGGVVLLYATGGGVTNPAGVDGQIATAAASIASAATARIGGVECKVLYAGAGGGLVAGGIQVAVEISAAVPSGPQPVSLTIGGVESQKGVTVWVQ